MSSYPRQYLASLDDTAMRQLCLWQTNFGYHPQTRDELYIPNSDRYKGTYILGRPGFGKSGLLQNLVIADMLSARSVIVIDPHEDLIDNCLHHVPRWRMPKTFVLDMRDEQFPFGINVFN